MSFFTNLFYILWAYVADRADAYRVRRLGVADADMILKSPELLSAMSLGELAEFSTLLAGVSLVVAAKADAEETKPGPPDDDYPVSLPGGETVRYGDIPKEPDGNISEAWLDEHCKCGRSHGKPGTEPSGAPVPVGMFL